MEIMALLEIEIGQMKVVGSFLDSSNCSIPGWGPVVEFSRNIGIPRRPIMTGVGQETTIEAIFDLNGLSHPGGIGVSLHGAKFVYVWVNHIKTNVIATSMSIQNIWRDPSIVCSVHALSGSDQLWGQVESFMPPLCCKSKCRVLWHHPPLLLKALILHTHIALLTEPWLFPSQVGTLSKPRQYKSRRNRKDGILYVVWRSAGSVDSLSSLTTASVCLFVKRREEVSAEARLR